VARSGAGEGMGHLVEEDLVHIVVFGG